MQNKKAVLSQGKRDTVTVLFGLTSPTKFTASIKASGSQASKLRSPNMAQCAKRNLTSAGRFGKEENDSIRFHSIRFDETVYYLLAFA